MLLFWLTGKAFHGFSGGCSVHFVQLWDMSTDSFGCHIGIGIMETLSATETYRRGFAKPISSLQRNLAKWVSAKSFNFITIYHCGIKHDQRWLDPEKKKHSMSAMSTFITPCYQLYKKLFPDFVSLWWHAEVQIAYNIQADTFSQKEKQYLNLR